MDINEHNLKGRTIIGHLKVAERYLIVISMYSRTSTYKNTIKRKIHNIKQASNKCPSHLTKKYSRYENENRKCLTRKVKCYYS